jgi:hypothetical protein
MEGPSMRSSAAILGAFWIVVFAAIPMAFSAEATGEVSVTFVNSFYYSETADKTPDKREATLSEIRNTLVDLGPRYLSPGQFLKIEVLDIAKVAWQTPPAPPAAGETHVAKPVTHPLRMEIQYSLRQNGKLLSRSRETISDISYLANPVPPESKDALFHVKEMLRDWFAQTFGASAHQPE